MIAMNYHDPATQAYFAEVLSGMDRVLQDFGYDPFGDEIREVIDHSEIDSNVQERGKFERKNRKPRHHHGMVLRALTWAFVHGERRRFPRRVVERTDRQSQYTRFAEEANGVLTYEMKVVDEIGESWMGWKNGVVVHGLQEAIPRGSILEAFVRVELDKARHFQRVCFPEYYPQGQGNFRIDLRNGRHLMPWRLIAREGSRAEIVVGTLENLLAEYHTYKVRMLGGGNT